MMRRNLTPVRNLIENLIEKNKITNHLRVFPVNQVPPDLAAEVMRRKLLRLILGGEEKNIKSKTTQELITQKIENPLVIDIMLKMRRV